MYTISQLRKNYYDYVKEKHPHILKWRWYSYRRFKAKVYIEIGCFLAYWFIKLKVKANYVTALYGIMGLSGGILLAIPSKIAILIAVLFFYFRGIIDVTDGIIARETKQTSINGTVFDSYAAHLGWISLWTGIGIYLGHSTSEVFYFLAPVIPALLAVDLHSNTLDTFIVHRILRHNERGHYIKDSEEKKEVLSSRRLRWIKANIDKIFEHNARTVDIICLAILINAFSPFSILWVAYLTYLMWQVVIFASRFYLLVRGKWAEEKLKNLEEALNIRR